MKINVVTLNLETQSRLAGKAGGDHTRISLDVVIESQSSVAKVEISEIRSFEF